MYVAATVTIAVIAGTDSTREGFGPLFLCEVRFVALQPGNSSALHFTLPARIMPWLAFGPHVGAALRNELQIGVSLKSRLRRELHPGEPIHTRIHLMVRDEQHQKGERPKKSEKGPRGPFHSLSSSSLLNA
jgi:hypothetical protein